MTLELAFFGMLTSVGEELVVCTGFIEVDQCVFRVTCGVVRFVDVFVVKFSIRLDGVGMFDFKT